MSLKPGIGAAIADRISGFYTSRQGAAVLAKVGTVSNVVRQDARMLPLGRYLRGRILDSSGIDRDAVEMRRQLEHGLALRLHDADRLAELIERSEGIARNSGERAKGILKRRSIQRRVGL